MTLSAYSLGVILATWSSLREIPRRTAFLVAGYPGRPSLATRQKLFSRIREYSQGPRPVRQSPANWRPRMPWSDRRISRSFPT